jgi:hypothetical protein
MERTEHVSTSGDAGGRWWNLFRRRNQDVLYGDEVVLLTREAVVIRRYYWPLGRKHISYSAVERVTLRPLKAWHGQFRVHGADLRGRWYSRDRNRGDKDLAIDLHVGGVVRPVLTPDDPERVLEILQHHMATERRDNID